jgi:ATP-dependent helicase/DNAse subunit B
VSEFYNARRTKNMYSPDESFRLSRSGIDQFVTCPRCFYLNRKLGLNPPATYPLTLNNAVDALMKREFDTHRMPPRVHKVVKEYGLDLVPFDHVELEEWRDAQRRGITYALPNTNLVVTGGIDDVWTDTKTNELTIVDYKATSTSKEITLDDAWKVTYKRQVEVYQWLFS